MGTLDTVQQEQLKAIGTYLSQIRQEQDRSLEDIAAKTYIPLRLLKAIEAGQERPLPEPVFIQGFIRRYGDALGLDGIDLSQRFPVHVTPLPVASATAPSRELKLRDAYEPGYGNVQVEEQEFPGRTRSSGQTNSLLPYIAAAAVLALVGIAFGIVKGISSREPATSDSTVVLPKQPSPEPSVASSAPSVSPRAASPKAAVSSSASPQSQSSTPSPAAVSSSPSSTTTSGPAASSSPKPANSAPVNVAANFTGDSWVQVIVDGQVREEGVLPKGTQKTWAGRREITILAGNAGAVSVTHNGSRAKVMGALGDVSEMTFRQ